MLQDYYCWRLFSRCENGFVVSSLIEKKSKQKKIETALFSVDFWFFAFIRLAFADFEFISFVSFRVSLSDRSQMVGCDVMFGPPGSVVWCELGENVVVYQTHVLFVVRL